MDHSFEGLDIGSDGDTLGSSPPYHSFMTVPFLITCLAVPSLLLSSTLAKPVEVVVTLDESKSGAAIPADFLGFSYEKNVLALDHFTPSNTAMVNLMRHLGNGVLRFGGNYVEVTRYLPGQPKSFSNQASVIGPRELEQMYGFARASGWKVIHGLNLGANDPAMAAAEAAEVKRIGSDLLVAFEIGNEPEHYGKVWRPEAYSYGDFRREVSSFLDAMRPQWPRVPLAGPGTTSNFPWFTGFIRDFRSDLVMTTRHNYPLAAATTDPAHPRFATIQSLLSPSTAAGWRELMGQHQKASKAAGIPYRIAEAGSASSGGKGGVSDVFASALWCADYLFSLAELGVAGINFHGSFNCRGYTSFCAIKGGGYHPHGNYYGMLFFRQAAQGRGVALSRNGDGVNLTNYAVLGHDGTLRVALINKDLENGAKVTLPLTNRSPRASVMRLNAPSIDAKTGITLGGAAVAPDGTWNPKPSSEFITASNGRFQIDVPAASAVLLLIDPENAVQARSLKLDHSPE